MIYIQNIPSFHESIKNSEGCLLCIDYGTKNTGIAISDQNLIAAMPLTVISPHQIIETIQHYHNEYQIKGIVIGLPFTKDYSGLHKITTQILKIAKEIENTIAMPILLQDERMSTVGAKFAQQEYRHNKKKKVKQQYDDHYAAQYVLDTVLQIIKRITK